MALVKNLPGPRQAAAILAPKNHIFLLSHMRAYTSLFGHIMGSNPAICGYYEMHIGYHSWKSLIRQKLLYFEEEEVKRGFTHMFDKVLHNDHHVAAHLLESNRVHTLFSLRRPQDVIPSILKLYSRVDPEHEFNCATFATRYYIERLDLLELTAKTMQRGYYYFDAEAVKSDTEGCLLSLSEWLNLQTPLSSDYVMQKKTSALRYGDSSERMSAGTVIRDSSGYEDAGIDAELLEMATQTYTRVRQSLLEGSARSYLYPAQGL